MAKLPHAKAEAHGGEEGLHGRLAVPQFHAIEGQRGHCEGGHDGVQTHDLVPKPGCPPPPQLVVVLALSPSGCLAWWFRGSNPQTTNPSLQLGVT